MLAEGGGEAVGSAFDKVLRHALSPLDAPALLRAAARYIVVIVSVVPRRVARVCVWCR